MEKATQSLLCCSNIQMINTKHDVHINICFLFPVISDNWDCELKHWYFMWREIEIQVLDTYIVLFCTKYVFMEDELSELLALMTNTETFPCPPIVHFKHVPVELIIQGESM
jgi:hypothetical protein